ncbi:MAG: hypothetical protein UW98_C0016G0002 [Parcubacteria group bacterium GW2011_GWC2_45_15]|nr:MAG: hypothetical protein UW98_C0016G0002 [Parcubacteria group bacterium GW2011_GWC2_45_15]
MVENEHPGGFKPAAADRQPEPNSGEGAASLEGKCVCSVCGATWLMPNLQAESGEWRPCNISRN